MVAQRFESAAGATDMRDIPSVLMADLAAQVQGVWQAAPLLRCRHGHNVHARAQLAMLLLGQGFGPVAVGRAMGISHSSVLYARGQHECRLILSHRYRNNWKRLQTPQQ